MIATLAGTERRTFKSWGNFNNLIGCPLCIDNTPDDAEVVVSEMGMNHKGEIATLAGLTRPDVGGFRLENNTTYYTLVAAIAFAISASTTGSAMPARFFDPLVLASSLEK